MPPSGDQGRNAIPRSRARVDLALGRAATVKPSDSWFWTETISATPSASSSWSTVAVGEADPAHLALVLELLERADRLGVGDVRVGAVVLVEVDAVGAERLQRRLAGLADVLGAAVELPRAAGPDVAGLGGDEDVVVAALQRLRDQPLVVADLVLVLAVGVGGVDQVHAGVERGVDGADRLLLRRSAGEGHRHRAEADREDLGVRQAAGFRLDSCHVNYLPGPLKRQTGPNRRRGPFARAHRAIHVAAPALRILGARPVQRPDRRAQRAPVRRPRAGRQVAAVAAARPLLVGPRCSMNASGSAARGPNRRVSVAEHGRAALLGGPRARARARARPRGSRAARRASRRAASCRRSPSPGPASRAGLPAEPVAAPERLVVDRMALDHRALRQCAG